uniref:Peptidase A1 domain-containing protein n=1 Tax=Arundo donax TaxID=35708 RepID=A0A0A9F9Y5_ARUDO
MDSRYSDLNTDGAFRFPVFHKNHPLLPSWIRLASIPDAGVIRDDSLGENVFFMAISLGTPAVLNLVTIDTGSSLSWVQCQHCDIRCHWQARKAGPIFNPFNSSTYRNVRCSTELCLDLHKRSGIPSGCVEEKDACLYRIRHALGEYSVGYLGKDKLTLPNNYTIDDFVFGCGADHTYNGFNAGIIGFRDTNYSFLNQVAQQTDCRAFSYCFLSNHQNEGFLSIGSYVLDDKLMLTGLISYGHLPFYAIQQIDMMVNGIRLEIHPHIYSTAMTIIDPGTTETFILSPVFHALDKAVTASMLAKGYARGSAKEKICFVTTGDSIDWNDLSTVEMKFFMSSLMLRKENLFYAN